MIHDKIKEVQDYFKKKLIDGDYEEVSHDGYNLWLKIDKQYLFILWIANGVEFLCVTDDLDEGSNEVLSFMNIKFSEYDKKAIWSKRMSMIDQEEKIRREAIEKRQYERLKKKYS